MFQNWKSTQNIFLINPRFPMEQSQELLNWAESFSEQFKSHVFLLSSGTTSQSVRDLKWVALSRSAILASAEAVNQHLQSNFQDVWLHALPDFHVGGLGIWARSYLSGAKVVKLMETQKWSVHHFYQELVNHSVTLSSLVPTQVYDLIEAGLQCPTSVRAILVGGGPLSLALYQKARALHWPLLPTYGMTETSSQVATASLDSLNQPSDEIPEIEIIPHLEVAADVKGCLQFKGHSLLSSYILWTGKKLECLDPKVNGWFISQDRGVIKGKRLQILGRIGEFFKIGGESVELGRLRETLDRFRLKNAIHADMTILAVPDERKGHEIHLVTEIQVDHSLLHLLVTEYNSAVLGFEKIRQCHFLERLPRNSLGKLQMALCLEQIKGSMNSAPFFLEP